MKNFGISIVHFIGDFLIWLAGFIKITSTIFKFMIVSVIIISIFFITIFATVQALHILSPYHNDIFNNDIWAWVIMIIGWTTMVYCFKKLLIDSEEKIRRMDSYDKIETEEY